MFVHNPLIHEFSSVPRYMEQIVNPPVTVEKRSPLELKLLEEIPTDGSFLISYIDVDTTPQKTVGNLYATPYEVSQYCWSKGYLYELDRDGISWDKTELKREIEWLKTEAVEGTISITVLS